MEITYGSICSGIEAASVAWESLGWKPLWFSEIKAFPNAVLKLRWPKVPNLGDMTKLAMFVDFGDCEAPDVNVGGTPCQAFSIAGMREGLADPRGELTMKYVEYADACDRVRAEEKKQPSIFVWENVPGVLSSKDNAFGCFLGAMAGGEEPLLSPRGKWPDAGCVFGPQRAIAGRVLDGQYFGLAQRRRRVFVVASARKDFHPAQVLFEFDGVRRDIKPSRQTEAKIASALTSSLGRRSGIPDCGSTKGQLQIVEVCPTLRAGGNSTGGHRPPGTDVDTAESLQVVAFGQNNTSKAQDVSHALNANRGCYNPGDFEAGTLLVQSAQAFAENSRAEIRFEGGDGSCIGALAAGGGKVGQGMPAVLVNGLEVRRLMVVECERLQGFPDDYTLVPDWNGWRPMDSSETPEQCIADGLQVRQSKKSKKWSVKDADGPRYEALGNSMAVTCMRWIGQRIELALLNPWEDLGL